jgi:hypothetical protein
MDPIFSCFVVGVLIVFLTLSNVVSNCVCNLIEEHGLMLLFEIFMNTLNVKPFCALDFGDLVL